MNRKKRDKIAFNVLRALHELSLRENWHDDDFLRFIDRVFMSSLFENLSIEERGKFIDQYILCRKKPPIQSNKNKNGNGMIEICIEKEGKIRIPNFVLCFVCGKAFDSYNKGSYIKLVQIIERPKRTLLQMGESCASHTKEEIGEAIQNLPSIQNKTIVSFSEKK